MYLITETYKGGINGGRYLISIYHVNNLKQSPSDVTEQIAKKFDLEYKKWKIIISHCSWTGFNRIKELLNTEEVYLLS